MSDLFSNNPSEWDIAKRDCVKHDLMQLADKPPPQSDANDIYYAYWRQRILNNTVMLAVADRDRDRLPTTDDMIAIMAITKSLEIIGKDRLLELVEDYVIFVLLQFAKVQAEAKQMNVPSEQWTKEFGQRFESAYRMLLTAARFAGAIYLREHGLLGPGSRAQ